MRAVLIEDLSYPINDELVIDGDNFHHLKNVLRIKKGKELLLLNGKGLKALTEVIEIQKKLIKVAIKSQSLEEQTAFLDLFVGRVKKDAMDLVLKQACELNIRKIIIGRTEFSQSYDLNLKRLKALLKSAVEQSNILYIPEVIEGELNALNDYENIIYFSSIGTDKKKSLSLKEKTILVFGPEGGLSEIEEDFILKKEGSSVFHLNTGIMRTTTAVSCGVGFYLGAISQK